MNCVRYVTEENTAVTKSLSAKDIKHPLKNGRHFFLLEFAINVARFPAIAMANRTKTVMVRINL